MLKYPPLRVLHCPPPVPSFSPVIPLLLLFLTIYFMNEGASAPSNPVASPSSAPFNRPSDVAMTCDSSMGYSSTDVPSSTCRRRNSVAANLEDWIHQSPPSEDMFVRYPNLAKFFVARWEKPRMSTNEIMERLNSAVNRDMSTSSRRRQ